jgi:hypothetical protein
MERRAFLLQLPDQRPATYAEVVRQMLFRSLPVGQHHAHGTPRADGELGVRVGFRQGFGLALGFVIGAMQGLVGPRCRKDKAGLLGSKCTGARKNCLSGTASRAFLLGRLHFSWGLISHK